MDGLQSGDWVNATYKDSKYHGRIATIDRKWKDAVVVFAQGVSMILPLDMLEKQEEGAGIGTYDI